MSPLPTIVAYDEEVQEIMCAKRRCMCCWIQSGTLLLWWEKVRSPGGRERWWKKLRECYALNLHDRTVNNNAGDDSYGGFFVRFVSILSKVYGRVNECTLLRWLMK
ncbi:hypothetical protein RJT34_25300 [Clitoria ternatea]|uniref:Uncharacterized protein n=1 Tax=Clitoria ternatea TaxID=43366 RepID=A0AAN9IGQ7_CLITE